MLVNWAKWGSWAAPELGGTGDRGPCWKVSMAWLYPHGACPTTQIHIFHGKAVPGSPGFRLGLGEALGGELLAAGASIAAGEWGHGIRASLGLWGSSPAPGCSCQMHPTV